MNPIVSKVTGGALNMRASASSSASVVTQIPSGKDLVVWSDSGYSCSNEAVSGKSKGGVS